MASLQRPGILLLASSLHIGGAEIVIAHLARNIDRERYRVSVACLQQLGTVGDALSRDGIAILEVPKSRILTPDYLSAWKILALVRRLDVELIHSHTTQGLMDASIARTLSRRLRTVHTFHFGGYPDYTKRGLLIERMFSRVPDQLVAVGFAQKSALCRTYGLPDSRIAVVHNGVNLTQDAPCGAVPYHLPGPSGRPIVVTIATLIQQKGLFVLLEVAHALKQRGIEARFVIAGEGYLRAALDDRRRALGLENEVEFLGWVQDAAQRLLPTADIVFQPSLWEAMSVVVIEALAAGRPVVVTDVGENSLVVRDGVEGFLVRPGDVPSMTTALTQLLTNPALRVRMGEAGRRRATSEFGLERMVRSYEEIYGNVLGPAHHGS